MFGFVEGILIGLENEKEKRERANLGVEINDYTIQKSTRLHLLKLAELLSEIDEIKISIARAYNNLNDKEIYNMFTVEARREVLLKEIREFERIMGKVYEHNKKHHLYLKEFLDQSFRITVNYKQEMDNI